MAKNGAWANGRQHWMALEGGADTGADGGGPYMSRFAAIGALVPKRRVCSDELLDRRELSDATWSAVQATLREREAIELCLLVGHYQGLASEIGGLGIQIEQGGVRADQSEEPCPPMTT